MTTNNQKTAARDVLGAMNYPGGWATGGFTTKLIDAITSADTTNRALLSTVYPELVEAVYLFKNVDDGVALLQERAA